MKVHLLLAEAACLNADGTISMLRAGISHIWGDPPYTLQANLVVQIETDAGDQGDHTLEVRCMDEDGKLAAPAIQGGFSAPQGGGSSTILLGLGFAFPKGGTYIFYCRVDKQLQDELRIIASKGKPKPPKGSG